MAIGDAPKPNTPESKYAERDRKISEIKQKLYTKVRPLKKLLELHAEVTERVEKLREKYKDHEHRSILHILTGSGILDTHTGVIEDDFPGEDSVEKFIDDLFQKYNIYMS